LESYKEGKLECLPKGHVEKVVTPKLERVSEFFKDEKENIPSSFIQCPKRGITVKTKKQRKNKNHLCVGITSFGLKKTRGS
jgi:hypothetical protein